ncbi:MAG TPA: response regulator transcription factor, partial [Thermomicrobiales bacterium]|nr:response regulator transcription factor [Thermomicrobiales bacterium]
GVAYVQSGELDRADATLAELECLLTGMPPADAPGEALAFVVQIALLRDDRARLERHAPALRRLRGRFHDVLIDRLLGEIALRAGDLAEAATLLADAETVARRERMPYELARTLEAKAALATLAGRPTDAAALLGEAADTLERVGGERQARRLRERARREAEPERERSPAGLTPREREVLRAVAVGKSNREIAAALFLSEKTVERHLSNIYAKTGAENRVAAAAFAIRHGLV